MGALTVAHGNVHNSIAAARRVRRLGADVTGLNEAHQLSTKLETLGRRVHTPQPVRKARKMPNGRTIKRNVSNDVATLVSKRFEYVGDMSLRICEQVSQMTLQGVAPDRWLQVSLFNTPRLMSAHVNVHLNAGPQALRGNNPDHPIVREYRQSVQGTLRVLELLDDFGFSVTLSGDMNMEDDREDPVPWSPYPQLRRKGFTIFSHGIDCIAWDQTFRDTDRRVIPAKKIGSDHAALRVRLVY